MLSLRADRILDRLGNSKLREYVDIGRNVLKQKLWKPRTNYSYGKMNVHWLSYLQESGVAHVGGVLQVSLADGTVMNTLLHGYIGWLVKRGYKPSGFRGRVSAAIGAQRMALHANFTVPLTWKLVASFETADKKCKTWLNVIELTTLNRFIWTRANDGTLFYFACKMVWMLTTELVYRLGSVIPANHSTAKIFCQFSTTMIKPVSKAGMAKAFELRLWEKTKSGVWRTIYVRKTINRAITLDLEAGGSYESIGQYVMATRNEDFRPDCILGATDGPVDGGSRPKRYNGKEGLNQGRYITWLKGCCKAAGVEIGGRSYQENRLPNAGDIRRSVMRGYAEYVGLENLRFYVGHSSPNTAKQFYLGFNDEEIAKVVGGVPWAIADL